MVRHVLARSSLVPRRDYSIVLLKPRQLTIVSGARPLPLASRGALKRLVKLPGLKSADMLARQAEGLDRGLVGVRKRPLLITVSPGTCCS